MISRPMPKAGPFANANQDFIDRRTVKSLGSKYTRRVAVPNGAKPLPLLITGREAREILSDAARIVTTGQAREIAVTRNDCHHGCKLYVEGIPSGGMRFFVMHNTSYGCDLGHNTQRYIREVLVAETIGSAWTEICEKLRIGA